MGQYYKTKKIYREYAKGGKNKDFFVQHQSEIELYEAAIKELKEICGDGKLPDVQILREQKVELTAKKQKQYEVNIAPQLNTPGRARCTAASLETEQSRRRGCTLTLPGPHGIIDVS